MARLIIACFVVAVGLVVSQAVLAAEPNFVPVYRLVKVANNHQEHLYTAYGPERDTATTQGYTYERIAFYVSSSAFSGGTEMFRLRKDCTGYVVRLYTISTTERDQAKTNGYVQENSLGYVYSSYYQGMQQVYRSYKSSIGDRFYTVDYAEYQATLNDGYSAENAQGYASPNGQPVNQAPNTPAVPQGVSSATVGQTVTFSTSTTDPDGDTLQYQFDFGDGVISAWDSSASASHSYSLAGSFLVRARARDTHQAISSWSNPKTINIVLANRQPNTPSRPSGPQSGQVGTMLTYSSFGTDPDGDPLEYQFDFGDNSTSNWSSLNNASHSFSSSGTYSVKARTRDTQLTSPWSDSLIVSITQTSNQPPQTPQTPAGPSTGAVGEQVNFSTSAVDPDGDPVCFQFDFGSEQSGWLTTGSVSKAFSAEGTYSVKARAKDDKGALSNWSSAHTIVISADTTVPQASIDSIQPLNPIEGEEVVGLGRATNNPLEYEWGCETHSEILSTSMGFSKIDFSLGQHKLYFKARNANGWSAKVYQTITVSRQNPTAEDPVVIAGVKDLILNPNDAVNLSPSASGGTGNFQWSLLTDPQNSFIDIRINSVTGAISGTAPAYYIGEANEYVFRVRAVSVTDQNNWTQTAFELKINQPQLAMIRTVSRIEEKLPEGRYSVKTLEIYNDGYIDLVITKIELLVFGEPNWLGNLTHSSGIVQPGTQPLSVQFNINAVNLWPGNYFGKITIENNSNNDPQKVIDVFLTVGAVTHSAGLITPINGAQNISVNPILDWFGYTNEEVYQIKIATDEQFQNLVVSDEVGHSYYQAIGLNSNQRYYWKVKIINPWMSDNSEAEIWCEVRCFTTYYNPQDPDRDGLDSQWEIDHHFDPYRPNLLLEIDCLEGCQPSQYVLDEMVDACAARGIDVRYVLDQKDLCPSLLPVPPAESDLAGFLKQTRNSSLGKYVHVVFAQYGEVGILGVNVRDNSANADIQSTGVFVFEQSIVDDYADRVRKQPNFSVFAVDELIAKVFIHELGHALGSAHEDLWSGFRQVNFYNVMVPGFALSTLRGEQNTDPDLGATGQGPRYSIEALAQFDLTHKLSVETAWVDLDKFTDNRGPIYIFHYGQSDRPDRGPVGIEAVVFDDYKELASVELVWRADRGPWQTVPMNLTNYPDRYHGVLPKQDDSCQIDYYIIAKNNSGDSQTDPQTAPEEVYTFALEGVRQEPLSPEPAFVVILDEELREDVFTWANPQETISGGYHGDIAFVGQDYNYFTGEVATISSSLRYLNIAVYFRGRDYPWIELGISVNNSAFDRYTWLINMARGFTYRDKPIAEGERGWNIYWVDLIEQLGLKPGDKITGISFKSYKNVIFDYFILSNASFGIGSIGPFPDGWGEGGGGGSGGCSLNNHEMAGETIFTWIISYLMLMVVLYILRLKAKYNLVLR